MVITADLLKDTFRLTISKFKARIQEMELCNDYYTYLCDDQNEYNIQKIVYDSNISITNVRSRIKARINALSSNISQELKKATHLKYKITIVNKTTIPEEFNALAFMRESVNKGYDLKQKVAQHSNETFARLMGFNPYSIKLTVSGYKSPLLAILQKNAQINAVFVESVDRLSRNLALTIDLLDYCSINKIKIYVGTSIMNRGVGRVTLLLLSCFAEFELTAKQTSYSNDLLNVAKFELDLIAFDQLSDSEIKLFNNLQFVERDHVFEKMVALSIKYVTDYDTKRTDRRDRRIANSEHLYNQAHEILHLLTDA